MKLGILPSHHYIMLCLSFLPIIVSSPLTAFIIRLFACTYCFCLLFAISFNCLFILKKVLRFGKFHDVNMLLFCKRGPDMFVLKKSYWSFRLLTQQFVIRSLISWICKRYFMSFRLKYWTSPL